MLEKDVSKRPSASQILQYFPVRSRSEAIRSLKLRPEASLVECAEARNAYTRRRLAQDFRAGLRELAAQAGDGAFDHAPGAPLLPATLHPC